MYHAASAIDTHDHLVGVGRGRQHRGNLQAEIDDRTGLDVAIEVQHEYTAAFGIRLVLFLEFLLACLGLALALLLRYRVGHRRLLDHAAHVPQPVVQQGDLDVSRGRTPKGTMCSGCRGRGQQDEPRDDDSGRLGEEAKVVEQELHGG